MKKTINKPLIALKLKRALGAKYRDTDARFLLFVSSIVRWIAEKITEDDVVIMLSGFGKFKNNFKKERTGMNIKTREKIKIPIRRSVSFSASPVLAKKIKYA